MSDKNLEQKLQQVTTAIVNELVSLTPETMSEIQFELVSTADGGADLGLIENHPDVPHITLSQKIYQLASLYLPLVKQYRPKWKRSIIITRETNAGWKITVDYE